MDGYLGQIMLWAGHFVPQNWAICQGQTLAIAQYEALYSIIGTYYGGDGRATFGLPDFRGRVPVGAGQGPGLMPYQMGAEGGLEIVRLSTAQMPAHHHENTLTISPSGFAVDIAIPSVSGPGDGVKPVNNTVLAKAPPGSNLYASAAADSNLRPFSATGTVVPDVSITNNSAGSGNPIENRQPYSVANYIICITGLYPQRN